MKKNKDLKSVALSTIKEEAAAIANLAKSVDAGFVRCVNLILSARGRVIVTGIGKSAIIGQKIVATFNSTGTPASFLHAADAIHGDLGTIQRGDIVICLSNSGETPEIKVLVPLLKRYGSSLIAMVGKQDSFLARQADLVIHTAVAREACPNNLAPTSSTTAQMVMGDALAVCLLEARGFTSDDFARLHPGGAIGKQLYLKVSDLYTGNALPKVSPEDDIRRVIIEISSKRLGATAVMQGPRLVGIITDGDLRRMLERNSDISGLCAADIMTRHPRTIPSDSLVVNALSVMREHNITQLLVVDGRSCKGIIHLHDILREGII